MLPIANFTSHRLLQSCQYVKRCTCLQCGEEEQWSRTVADDDDDQSNNSQNSQRVKGKERKTWLVVVEHQRAHQYITSQSVVMSRWRHFHCNTGSCTTTCWCRCSLERETVQLCLVLFSKSKLSSSSSYLNFSFLLSFVVGHKFSRLYFPMLHFPSGVFSVNIYQNVASDFGFVHFLCLLYF